MGTKLGPWTDLKAILIKNDPRSLIDPLVTRSKKGGATMWSYAPYIQFGITTVLCEGGGAFTTKQQNNLDSGAVLMKSIAEYCQGTRQ